MLQIVLTNFLNVHYRENKSQEADMKNFLFLACLVVLFAVLGLAACSSTSSKVYPLMSMPDKANPGAIYILPKTIVALKIPIKITTTKFNEFRSKSKNFKDCKNDLKEIFQNENGEPRFETGDIQVVREFTPDPNNIYNIDLSTTFLKDTKKKLVFNESGMLVSADYASKDKTLEFSFQVLESVAKVGGAVLKGGTGVLDFTDTEFASSCPPEYLKDISTYYMLVAGKDRWLLGMNSAGIDRSVDVFNARSTALDARIEEVKSSILGKEVTTITITCPIDEDILLKGGKKKLLSLVAGEVATKKMDAVIKKVQEKAGKRGLGKLQSIEVLLKVNDSHPSLKVKGLVEPPKGVRGLYYRVPGEVAITVLQGDKVISDTFKVAVAQLGPVLSLPSKMHTTDVAFSMEFFTDTGSLKSLGVETKAIDLQQIEKIGNSGVALVQTIAGSNDEITRLKRENEKLSLEMDNRELKEGKRPPK